MFYFNPHVTSPHTVASCLYSSDSIWLTTVSSFMKDECLEYSETSSGPAPAPRQYKAPMAGNHCNLAMSPCAVFQAPATLTQQWRWQGEGEWAERSQQMHVGQRCTGNCSILWPKHHMNTADKKYQLHVLPVVNFVKLHLMALKLWEFWK